MRKFLPVLLIIFCSKISVAQTVKTVGGTGGADYSTIAAAFMAINVGSITGSIELQIISSTSEPAYAPLIASGSGSANYTSVSIYPTASGCVINSTAAGDYLLYINGADNVTIDGRVNKTGSTVDLTISNGTRSAIYLAGASTNNTIRYCNLKGSWATSQYGGIISLGNNWEAIGGINNNTIEYNNITNGGTRPYNAIYSKGISGTPNSGNTIQHNNFYDIFSATGGRAIDLELYNSAWTIEGNSFYETTNLVNSSTSSYDFVYVYELGSGTNFTVSNNYFGGTAPLCGGTKLTKPASNTGQIYCIELNTRAGSNTEVQGNKISNIEWINTGAYQFFGMIIGGAGNFNVGTTSGNTIGSNSGVDDIIFTAGSANAQFEAIEISSSGTVNVQNNIIGGIKLTNSDATAGNSFRGIYKTNSATGSVLIDNNIIGNASVGSSINLTSTATGSSQSAYGVYSWGSGTTTITNNTIANIVNEATGSSSYNAGILLYNGDGTVSSNNIHDITSASGSGYSDYNSSISAIAVSTTSTNTVTVSNNIISALQNTKSNFQGYINGIYFSGGVPTSGTNVISKNFIRGLSITGGSSLWGNLSGIRIGGGKSNYYNNLITLSSNNTCSVFGIYETGASGSDNNLYFNTVYLGGTLTSGSNKSCALYTNAFTNNRDFRNNILHNTRANVGGAYGKHYAMYYNYATTSGLTVNYNDYYVSGAGTVLGYFNGGDVTTIASLRNMTTQDANSINSDPTYANASGTSASDFIPSRVMNGLAGLGITLDYLGSTRDLSNPSMGALNSTNTLPVSWLSFTGRAIHGDVELNWSTASELNNSHFEIQRTANAIDFSTIGSVAAGTNQSVVNNYQYLDLNPLAGASYYRLKQVDIDGKYSFSSIIQINGTPLSEIKIYNDAEALHVLVPASVSGTSIAFIYDAAGRVISKQQVLPGRNIINTARLSGGNYFVQLVNGGKNIYSNQFVK
jgi:hypothetical protein